MDLPIDTVGGGNAAQGSDTMYRLILAEDTPIEWSGSSRVDDMAVEIRDNNGNPLGISLYSEVEGFEDAHVFFVREVLPAGTYYLNVKFVNTGNTGAFLTLLQTDHRYQRQQRQCPAGQLGIDDPLHGCQWHLHNTGQLGGAAGQDINLGDAWAITKGEGVNVTVVDEGIDYLHADLRDNFDPATSDSAFGDDPTEELLHENLGEGTFAAGIIAARDNGEGLVGVAPRATISAYQLFGHGHTQTAMNAEAEAFSLHAADVSIRSHSWSARGAAPRESLAATVEAALDTSRMTGDDGQGTLQIMSAGGSGLFGGYSSYSPYLNYRGFAAICGVDDQGHHNPASNRGPNLWVCAPSNGDGRPQVASTLRTGQYMYPDRFFRSRGPKTSTPIVSGVAALVRAVDRGLSWRDVKLILADSARVVDSSDSSWLSGAAKYSSPSSAYRYSHKFGFGVVDAERAVGLAQNWTPLPDEKSVSATQNTAFTVADMQTTAVQSSVTVGGAVTFVEHVEVTLNIDAPHFRDLDIELVSPSGTVSKLSIPYQCEFYDECGVSSATVLSSTRHLGEDPRGDWTLRMSDLVSSGAGAAVASWSLEIHGHTRALVEAPAAVWVSEEAGSVSVELSGDPLLAATVTAALVDGTATGGSDCSTVGTDFDNSTPAALMLAAGTSAYTTSAITVCSDTDKEGDETFQLRLTASPGVFNASESHCASPTECTVTVTIIDDESLGAPILRHVVAGEGSLTVAWAPAIGASGIVGYDVRYIESSSTSKSDDSAWTVEVDVWTGGSLVAVVDGLTAAVSYDVAMRARSDTLTSDWSMMVSGTPMDPGSTVMSAATIHSGVPLHAELSSATDVDFFTFTVTEKSEYIIWSTGDTDTMVELTRSDGTSHNPPTIHNNWQSEPGPNNFMLFGTITPGTYFFKVTSGSRFESATTLWQSLGAYSLHLHLGVDTTGRNDAIPVKLNSRTAGVFTQRVDFVPDRDFFKLELSADTTISVHAESNTLALHGQIINSSGEVIVPNRAGLLEPSWPHVALRESLKAGIYYIVVGSAIGVGDPYFLYVNESPVAASARAEAVTLPMDVVAGGIASYDSEALFQMVLTEDAPIEVSASSAIGEMTFELWDRTGRNLGTSFGRRSLPVSLSAAHGFTAREFLEAGTYYLNAKFSNPGVEGPFLMLVRHDHRYARLLRQCPAGQLGIDDHLHGCQWHLSNTGQSGGMPGEDINLGDVWNMTKGEGINVTVVDEGIDYLHADLRYNFDLATSGSAFGDNLEDELPKEFASHGTRVAGIIAARDNGVGVVGVAPRATISAYQALGNREADLAELVEAYSLHADEVSIRNHSWGPSEVAPRTLLPTVIKLALENARTTGDDGQGILQIQAGGNANKSGGYTSHNRYLNDRGIVAVCGVDDQGHHFLASNQGPNLWVCAPTINDSRPGITTTDSAGRYWLDFGGTSAATPIVSGVAALVRAVDRGLSWRDVKLILADSARVVDSSDSSWLSGAAKYSSPSSAYRYSHKFGFGVVDAERAVGLAQNWTPLPDEKSVSATQNTAFTVADMQTTAVQSSVTVGGAVTFVEHVEVTLNIDAPHFRDLDIELVSPSGTVSKLSIPYQCEFYDECGVSSATVLSSTRHLGEDPRGDWTLRMSDLVSSGAGAAVASWSLEIHGHTRALVEAPAAVWVSEEAGSVSVELSGDPLLAATVTAALVDGTATGGSDCSTVGTDFDNSTPAALMLAAGTSAYTTSAITVCSDTDKEGDETFQLRLTASPGVFNASESHCASPTECTVTVTIIDDDTVVKVPSDWGLIPSGMSTGDQFRLLFKTSTTRDAAASRIEVYDSFVRAAAVAPEAHDALEPYADRFKVFGSTEAVSARLYNALWNGTGWVDGSTSVSSSGVPTYWLGGAKYADNYFELCAFSALSDAEKTALENQFYFANIRLESGSVETASRKPFTGTSQSCATSASLFLGASPDAAHGAAGAAAAGGNAWDVSPWSEGTTGRSELRPFYALSTVFEISDDPIVDLVVSPASVTEGNSVALSVRISEAQKAAVTIPVVFTDDTATGGADYTPVSSLVIGANMTESSAVMLATAQDSVYEGDETFDIALGRLPDSVQVGSMHTASVTITDDADRPQMSIAWTGGVTTVAEGAEASFTVTAERESSFDQRIAVSTMQATAAPIATSDVDYTALSGTTVTLTAGTTTVAGKVKIASDRFDEPAREKFRVRLDAPASSSGYTLDSTDFESADIGIIDQNPTAITLSLKDGTAAIAENGGSKVLILATSRPMTGTESLTVRLALAGTAAAGVDYELSADCESGVACDLTTDPANPTFTFTAGGQTASLTLTALQDTIDESTHETVVVAVDAFASSDWMHLDGGADHRISMTTFTITDDDLPQSLEAPVMRHAIAGEKSLTVAWAAPTGADATVGYDVRYINSASTDKNDDSAWTVVEDAWDAVVEAWAARSLTAVLHGLTDGTSYDVEVRAITDSLSSDWSNRLTGTPADPGSTVSAAATARSDIPLHAELSSSTDVDFYTFTVTEESEYMIWTTGDTDTLGELTLTDGTSRTPRIVHNNVSGRSGGPDNFMLFGRISPGEYFFKVTPGTRARSSTVLWQGTGPYVFHLHLSPDTTGIHDARSVSLGSKSAALLKTPDDGGSDRDFFELVLPTATTVSAHVELPSLTVIGQILDSKGNVIVPSQAGYLEPVGTQVVLHENLEAGVYYIQLTSETPRQDEPYFFYVQEAPSPATIRTEAVALPVHTVAGGTASHDRDSLFRIVIEQDAMVELSGSSRVGEMNVELQNELGVVLDVSDYAYIDTYRETLSTVHTFLLREYLEAGTYYLNIRFADAGAEGRFLALMHYETDYAWQARQCPAGQLGIEDHLHGCQWHLRNTGQFTGGAVGEDINLGRVWDVTRGEGVNVTVVDEGIDYLHNDLRSNFYPDTSGSAFGDPTVELLREADEHGTLVAGIIAARDDGVGVVGVAPRATVSAYQIFDDRGREADTIGLVEAFSLRASDVSIRHHSWGSNQLAPRLQLPAAIKAALDASMTTGDDGRGTLQIQSAGNENLSGGYTSHSRYLNYRGFAAVCGIDDQGEHYINSNQGPNLWVCAPTRNSGRPGIATTRTRNTYWPSFGGTSAAAPIVSGVAALVRSANRSLSWRDTKLILADSARSVDSTDDSWSDGAAKYSSPSTAYRYSHKFGFGVVDAEQALALAQNWTPLPAELSTSVTNNSELTIDSVNPNVQSSVTVTGSMTFVEHVTVTLNIATLDFRDLDIELESPSGTISKLSVPFACGFASICDVSGSAAMSSTRHLGENPAGDWTLRIADTVGTSFIPTTVRSWTLQIHGHVQAATTSNASLSVSPEMVTEGGSFDYEITLDRAPGAGRTVTVNFITDGGTATAGEDYTAVLQVGADAVTFGPADTSKTVTVNTLRGTVGDDEPTETLRASISRATLYVGSDTVGTPLEMSPRSVTVEINDHPDDLTGVWFEASVPGVVKNREEALFVARITNPLSSDIDVRYRTVRPSTPIMFYGQSVTRAQANDFVEVSSATVTIAAGETSASFTVATIDDADSDYEFFRVRARGRSPAGTTWRPDALGGTQADMVIEPDVASDTIYVVADPKAPREGDTIRLSAHFSEGWAAADRTSVDVSAAAVGGASGDDFTLTDGSLHISRGEQSTSSSARQSGEITIAVDADYDPGEMIALTGVANRPNVDVLAPVISIGNTTPLSAALEFTDPNEDYLVPEGGSVGVTVSLGRALTAGETIDVTLRLPHDAAGTILGDATLTSAGNSETGFSVVSALADVTRVHPDTNKSVKYQEMKLRFTGAGARSGTLTLILGDDGVEADPMLVIALRVSEVSSTGVDEEVAVGAKSILLLEAQTEGVVITPLNLAVEEGATAAYQVSLRSVPGGTVTVTAVSTDETVATVKPSSLTFSSSGADIWSTPRTVTVTAVSDDDGFDEVAGITHTVSGYGDVTVGAAVRVAVSDDDIFNYTVAHDWPLIPSGVSPGESFRLVLATSQTTAASSDRISFYNRFVERAVAGGHTDIASYAKGFRAWLSTAGIDARDNTRTSPAADGAGHRVYWLGSDTKAADDNAGLYGDGTGGWAASGAGRDENGASVAAATTAWWGSSTNGKKLRVRHVRAGAPAVRLTDVGNPTDASDAGAASVRESRVLAISPVFTVEETPVVSIASNADTVTEGTAITFTLSAVPAPDSELTVNLFVGESSPSDFLDSAEEGIRQITIAAGADSATFMLPTLADSVDEPTGWVIVEVESGDGYEPDGLSRDSVWVQAHDDDQTSVALTGAHGALIEGDTRMFTVSIGRGLTGNFLWNETLTVPLTFAGTAEHRSDYMLACESPLPTGVTCQNFDMGVPQVTFAGSLTDTSASSVTITLTTVKDASAEAGGETVNIGIGAVTHNAELSGGAATPADNFGEFKIHDDTAGVTITESGVGTTVGESSGSDSYTVVLDSRPTANVMVTVTSGTPSAALVDGPDQPNTGTATETLTFTASTW
ncbi:MAG: S8 family serine peptidase, partial [Acidimicrobiaceae bacterium]|nr:S8 family serine peptidase [Acidimicrobiaceae bacterium]